MMQTNQGIQRAIEMLGKSNMNINHSAISKTAANACAACPFSDFDADRKRPIVLLTTSASLPVN
jgi:hypothetical protein